jgi:predicted RNA-binding Zn-ribbon protein involved in translation (DUF1610 family)
MPSDFVLFTYNGKPQAECKVCHTIFDYDREKTKVLICPECGEREDI